MRLHSYLFYLFSFFFTDTATTEIYTLSLHDALPICAGADASSAGMVDSGFENQKELTKMQLDNQKEIAELHFSKLFLILKIGRAVQQECRDRSRMPSSA